MSLNTGNLYGTVVDEKGQALPGVNAQGQFRFLNLAPATYSLEAQLEGFTTYEIPRINIQVGRNTNLEITLQPAIE